MSPFWDSAFLSWNSGWGTVFLKNSTVDLSLTPVTVVFGTGYFIWLSLEIVLVLILDAKRGFMGAGLVSSKFFWEVF